MDALIAPLPGNPANAAVVLAVVLGLRTVEMPATQNLIIHGPRAFGLAKVGCGQFVPCIVVCVLLLELQLFSLKCSILTVSDLQRVVVQHWC